MKMAASIAPAMLPIPPRMMMASSREIRSYPVFGLNPPPVAPNTMPPTAVTATPMPNVSICTRFTLMPMIRAAVWSCMVARIVRPNWVRYSV